jgi:hypothetical protein
MTRFFTFLFVVSCFAFSTQSFAQTGWVKQSLDTKVSVKFPKAPEVQEAGPTKIYKLLAEDSTAYTANAVDFEPLGLDSATLATMAPTEEFADQFKNSFTTQLPGLKITQLDIAKWKDFNCYNIEGEVAEKKIKVYIKCVFIGSKLYSLFCAVSAKSDIKNKDTFINSIELQ